MVNTLEVNIKRKYLNFLLRLDIEHICPCALLYISVVNFRLRLYSLDPRVGYCIRREIVWLVFLLICPRWIDGKRCKMSNLRLYVRWPRKMNLYLGKYIVLHQKTHENQTKTHFYLSLNWKPIAFYFVCHGPQKVTCSCQ